MLLGRVYTWENFLRTRNFFVLISLVVHENVQDKETLSVQGKFSFSARQPLKRKIYAKSPKQS